MPSRPNRNAHRKSASKPLIYLPSPSPRSSPSESPLPDSPNPPLHIHLDHDHDPLVLPRDSDPEPDVERDGVGGVDHHLIDFDTHYSRGDEYQDTQDTLSLNLQADSLPASPPAPTSPPLAPLPDTHNVHPISLRPWDHDEDAHKTGHIRSPVLAR